MQYKVPIQSMEVSGVLPCRYRLRYMFGVLIRRFHRLYSGIRWWVWRRPQAKVVIRRFKRLKCPKSAVPSNGNANGGVVSQRPIRLATFNAALFSLAPAVSKADKAVIFAHEAEGCLNNNGQPKSILKTSPLHSTIKNPDHFPMGNEGKKHNKSKVSINLPENEISLAQNKALSVLEDSSDKIIDFSVQNLAAMRSPVCFPASMFSWTNDGDLRECRSIYDVLKEVDADILALQDVKAEEEKSMKPLSGLAQALGMHYVFAESWAPEYGNAILSKWPIKKWKIQKIYDDRDFRNVLKATIDIPWAGELNFYCTQLDHLDESWRMKQMNAIMQSNNDYQPHFIAGGLNSLDGSDYSSERWMNIVKYYEEIGKPTPKVEVMNFLNGKKYVDAKEYAGECEPVVIIAKGQNVQGTCKYGTRVDYILASPDNPYCFVPGSYSVISSKGTSDHHLVKVDVIKEADEARKVIRKQSKKLGTRVVKFTNSCSSGSVWKL
ncbi:hypothetical protein LIER_20119 [Lithospermum erythrorhizon]|uniref:Endonuclease/exonuclease/phosphatase domain-containing protein n=1 Tax=Lithospermum erythrorhizon TaxID=34254 RepID=A0AAV3QN26_LITER